jgi:hypothetical protein
MNIIHIETEYSGASYLKFFIKYNQNNQTYEDEHKACGSHGRDEKCTSNTRPRLKLEDNFKKDFDKVGT